MAFSGLAFVNLFILTIVMCLPSPKFFLWDCVWGGGRRGKGEGRRRGKKGEKREGGGRRGKEGVGCVFVIKPLKQVS